MKQQTKVTVLWLDRQHAFLHVFTETGIVEVKKYVAHHTDHHTHALDAFDAQREESTFFRDLAKGLEGADKVLILGPGMAKYHLRSYLMEQWPMVARRIDRVESSDHPTEAQIAAIAKAYFEKALA